MEPDFKTVAATDLKNRLGEYLGVVIYGHEPILIEKHGRPVAVIQKYEDWMRERGTPTPQEEGSWFKELKKLVEEIQKRHPNTKPFSAVELIRQIRDEEEN